MVEKFEAGKWYKSSFGECPFFIESVDGARVTMSSWDSFERRVRSDVIEPEKIRQGYYNDFREVSQDELERLSGDFREKIEFFKRE